MLSNSFHVVYLNSNLQTTTTNCYIGKHQPKNNNCNCKPTALLCMLLQDNPTWRQILWEELAQKSANFSILLKLNVCCVIVFARSKYQFGAHCKSCLALLREPQCKSIVRAQWTKLLSLFNLCSLFCLDHQIAGHLQVACTNNNVYT